MSTHTKFKKNYKRVMKKKELVSNFLGFLIFLKCSYAYKIIFATEKLIKLNFVSEFSKLYF